MKIVTDMRTSGGISIHKFRSKINFKLTCLCTKLTFTRLIHDKVPQCMLFANDIVFVDESRYGVDFKLEIWRDTLDRKTLG